MLLLGTTANTANRALYHRVVSNTAICNKNKTISPSIEPAHAWQNRVLMLWRWMNQGIYQAAMQGR